MAMPTCAFVAEIGSNYIRPFRQQLHTVSYGYFAAFCWFLATIPYRKNNAPFRRAVYLNAEVTASESTRLIVGPYRVGFDCNLVIEPRCLHTLGNRKVEMYTWRAAL